MIDLHPYQQDCFDAVVNGFKTYRRQLLVIPTGGGKTPTSFKIAEHYFPGRILFLANRDELIEQAVKELYESIGVYAQVEKAGKKASLNAQVVVASIQSMRGDRLARWPVNHFKLIIYDEAQFSLAKESQAILRSFDAFVMGMTATPNRSDKRNLGEFYENIAKEINFFDLVHQGYLCKVKFKTLPIKVDLSNVGTGKTEFGTDFKAEDLSDALEPYFERIALAIKEHARFRRTLVFLPLIITSKKFVDVCNSVGLSARHIDGESPDRDELKAAFKRGEFEVLSNAMLLSYGYNDRGIDCVVNLRLTKSISLFWQMLGRGTRTFPGKRDLLFLDFLWQHAKYGVIRPAHLIAQSEEEAQEMIELAETKYGQATLDLEDLQIEASGSREEKLRRELEKNAKRNGYTIDAADFCLSSGRVNEAKYEPTMEHEKKPVSVGQMEVLAKNSINPKSVTCAGHAEKIIGLIQERVMQNRASPAQLRKLIQMGHPNPNRASSGEAGRFMRDANFRNEVWAAHRMKAA